MAKIALKTEAQTPVNPAAGYVYLYAKPDGILYKKGDDGVEHPLGGVQTKHFGFFGALVPTVGNVKLVMPVATTFLGVFASVGSESTAILNITIKKNGVAAETLSIPANAVRTDIKPTTISVTPTDYLTADIIDANDGENLTLFLVYTQ